MGGARPLKLGLIADVHCNLAGLQRALDLLGDCDEVLCAGDLLYQFRFSNDVLWELRRRQVRAILGNHDKSILYEPALPLRSSPTLDQRCLAYLASLPNNLRVVLNGTRVAMFHGSPWDDLVGVSTHYIFPEDKHHLMRLAGLKADVIVLGHTHVPMELWVGDTLVVNPGSCGEPHDITRSLSCATLDLNTCRVELRRFSLDGTS